MKNEINDGELIHVQFTKDDRCIDMLLTLDEIETGATRALDPNNSNLLSPECCTCWSIEKPPKCTFWNRLLFKCSSETKE
jgi:hypothetical protein